MQKYECKNCGAELKWNPTTGALTCDYCDESYSVSDFEDTTIGNVDTSDEQVIDAKYVNTKLEENQLAYKCGECGAEIIATNTTMSTECAYCGRPITITSKIAGEFRPELIVPYKIEKETAKQNLREYLKKSPFTPKRFVEESSVENVKGLYIPFFLHSFGVKGSMTYECEKITDTRDGNDKIEEHEVYLVDMNIDTYFDRLPIDGVKAIDDKIIAALEPFDFSTVAEYNPAYMSGYYAEQPDETKESTKERAIDRGISAAVSECLTKTTKYQRCLQKHRDVEASYDCAEYAMLPIWRLNVNYRDKIYSFDVNGQTGRVTGLIPISIPKVCAAGGIVSVLFALLNFLL